ncbi:LytTR family transcriptional regulator [Flavobacterium arcticum]|uniref:LytTR family transcriptional regulator n=1 Tax=Flavobacterium arcticum TaxID=1784713 RepID=A0A345HC83_9FLAO|nr:LytTR family DNA-binding domain-containing protein [Flavobacterium arcticum]AXG74193.1 LytTR family transcriptional regulator [Flavobacterium arcticum]KAF2508219.1 LytTR family transcriptional regulator [Flavobacterium arcticum]
MTNIKIILLFFFCAISNGQQVDSFITQPMVDNPSKTIDSLARITLVTPYEAAKNYYILGKCHAYLNQEEVGFEYFIQSKKAFEALGNVHFSKQIALEAHKIISAQEYYGNYGNTLFEEYQHYADSINSPLHKAYVIAELAKDDYYTYDETGDVKYLDRAYSLFRKALRYANTADNNLIKAKLYSNIGSLKNTMHQCDSARFYLDESKIYIDEIDDAYENYGYYHNYANSYFLEENYQKAIPYFLKAKDVVPYYKGKALRKLYSQLEEAYDYLDNDIERRKYQRLHDSLDRVIKDRLQNVKMHETTVKYDVEKKDKKITALERALLSYNKHRVTYSVILFLVFLLALYSFVRWKKVDVKRKKIEQEKKGIESEHIKTIEQLEKVKQLVIEEHIVLKNKVKIHVSDLMYIKSEDHYLNFIPFEGKKQFIRGKISEVLEELPPNFVKCHRSYIVNTNYIKTTSSKGIILTNNEQIPVSRNFKL